MSNEIIEKLKQGQELTLEEISFVLPEIVSKATEMLDKVPLGNEKKCVESDMIMQIICDRFNLDYFSLDTRELKDDDLFHKFGLVIFNDISNRIIYLFDLTYNQFKVEPEYKEISPSHFLKPLFLDQLINNKYLPFTREIFENYIMSFISASTKINKNNFFNSIHDELKKFGIRFNSDDQFSSGTHELALNVQK